MTAAPPITRDASAQDTASRDQTPVVVPGEELLTEQARLLLVASSGGHLLELLSLQSLWIDHPRCWVTFPLPDAQDLLAEERVIWAHHPTNRNVRNLLRNTWLAWRMLRRERPDVVISTGAGVAVPFIWAARALGITTVYVESLTRIHELSLTGRLVYPVANGFYVQWPELAARYARAEYRGQII